MIFRRKKRSITLHTDEGYTRLYPGDTLDLTIHFTADSNSTKVRVSRKLKGGWDGKVLSLR